MSESTFVPYTDADRAQFAIDMTASRIQHCNLVDHLIGLVTSGAVTAVDKQAATEMERTISELYTLNNAKAPWGVRPKTDEAPQLNFSMKVKK